MTFEYHWHRGEANFGPVIETEVKKGTHFTIESVLMFEGKFVALRRPNAIPHHEIPERVGKDFLYFVHDLPIWGESLEAYLKRIVLEQAGVEINNFRVFNLTMNIYEEELQWAMKSVRWSPLISMIYQKILDGTMKTRSKNYLNRLVDKVLRKIIRIYLHLVYFSSIFI